MSEPVYRTELSRTVDDGWELSLDGDIIAATDTSMPAWDAHAWAQSQMGEGVTFYNGLVGEPADSWYWVAGPTVSWDEFMATRRDDDVDVS